MISPKSLRQLAAYSISLPAFAVSPKLAKETVYMPSQVAARTLGAGSPEADRAASASEREISNNERESKHSEERKELTRLRGQDRLL